MDHKNLLIALGFSPKENAVGVFSKKYPQADNYCLEVDFENETINYGGKIKAESKTTQNFSQPENFVVLECVNRLLEKGYKPEKIVLEKIYPTGHGTSGRLDILVIREEQPYLMIECKTYGEEFEKELKNIQKNGGQLFTYFQQDTKAELLMLYTSKLSDNGIVSDSKIIKIEDDFRNAGSVKNAFERWDKKFHEKGFWENPPYNFQSKGKNTILDLEELTADKGQTLFNQFAEILRRHSVSDKPNAFNVIFNLFLAKIWDEHKAEDEELKFQWNENDDAINFQVTLYNLHKEGLKEFLKKEMEGIYKENFQAKTPEELKEAMKKVLKTNSLFAIKNVIDDADFERNHRVLVEVVKMLQGYRVKYPRKQKYLSEFFERLLTVGLKQEVGQYFTPPPITKFIVRSLPLPEMIKQTTKDKVAKLPAVIDYAAGSGHFLTEIMEEYQNIIDKLDTNGCSATAKNEVNAWKVNQYSWAGTYIYGIEKDYRLVKVAKVGCYFYGDGLAQIIYGDGLDSFKKSEDYRGLLEDNAQEPQFSIVVSNPPYAVNDCKDDLEYLEAQNDFELYKSLTYNSKEIECLFVERTKQLLKTGGVAGIILPSSIFSNTGIYTKAREIILQYFDIIAITELGSNTFMATGTNTVVLFLRKRDEKEVNGIKEAAYNLAKNYPKTQEDLTINGIEKPVKNYLNYTSENEIDPEKFYYFILNFYQKTVIIKTGQKDAEKKFLGYEYSNRRGHEGMHPIQRGKTIEECTKLYNENDLEDEQKASSYIYKAFNGDADFPIHESLKNNISCIRLVDMLVFDRPKFEKNISTAIKKKVRHESKWELTKLGEILSLEYGKALPESKRITGNYPVMGSNGICGYHNEYIVEAPAIIIGRKGSAGKITYVTENCYPIDTTFYVKTKNDVNIQYLYNALALLDIENKSGGIGVPGINRNDIYEMTIPLPSKETQQKIVSEIEVLEKKEVEAKAKIESLRNEIVEKADSFYSNYKLHKLGAVCDNPIYGANESAVEGNPEKDYRYVRITDIKDDGTLNEDWKTAQKVEEKYILTEGDFLFARSGATAGKTFLYKNKYGKALYAGYLIKFPVKKDILNSIFLNFILKGNIYQNWVLSMRNGTAQPNINAQQYSSFEIPLPPLPEQQKIISEIEEIETQIAEAQKIIDEIPAAKNTVLKKYL